MSHAKKKFRSLSGRRALPQQASLAVIIAAYGQKNTITITTAINHYTVTVNVATMNLAELQCMFSHGKKVQPSKAYLVDNKLILSVEQTKK